MLLFGCWVAIFTCHLGWVSFNTNGISFSSILALMCWVMPISPTYNQWIDTLEPNAGCRLGYRLCSPVRTVFHALESEALNHTVSSTPPIWSNVNRRPLRRRSRQLLMNVWDIGHVMRLQLPNSEKVQASLGRGGIRRTVPPVAVLHDLLEV